MPIPDYILKPDDPARDIGIVYRDISLSSEPAAHVLIIGVAAYRSTRYKHLLKTATISAREVADWFIDDAKARFANPDCRLGSVAIILSETADTAKAIYAGGEVPRATFDGTKAAVRAWVQRINTHKDNLAILYVASHGESFLNRTTFLLEDFGTDSLDATAGMAEVEQFMGSLENATPIRQLLLFDCCRNPTSEKLPWNEPMGNKLISLTRQPNDHGEPRKQWVICSTSLGEYAGGLATGPTLFNMALIDALNGVASDTSTEGWPVRPGLLVDKIDRILALHRLPEEKAQTPGGRLAGTFEITYPGEQLDVPIYITLDDPAEWVDSTINITIDGKPNDPITGLEGQSPFHICRSPELSEIQVEAEHHGTSLGKVKAKVRAPALFLKIKKSTESFVTEVGQLSTSRDLIPSAQMVISVNSPARVLKGAVATIVQHDAPNSTEKEIVVDLGSQKTIDLEPGNFTTTLRTPDGHIQTREVTLGENQIQQVQFATLNSPHEWMSSATVVGAIKPFIYDEATENLNISVTIAGTVSVSLDIRQTDDAEMSIEAGPHDNRFLRYEVNDNFPSRFEPNMELLPWKLPVFSRITCENGREELAVIPSLGHYGRHTTGGWTPSLLVDRKTTPDDLMTTVIVDDDQWNGLLGFLGSRDFVMGTRLLDSGLGQSATEALYDKVSNPLAAVAGALIVVAAAAPDIETHWDPWLMNLANWFNNIPDGPIILGRRLLMLSRTEDHIAQARHWFTEGYRRGVPYYSLSIDWLARGLDSIPGDDDALIEMRKTARYLSNRVDPTRTFTVIHIRD